MTGVDYPDIAVIGKAGAGKTTIAGLLCELGGYAAYSFAQPLKDVAEVIWGASGRTDRDKLQRLGVAVREIDEDAWLNLMAEELDHATGPVVIDDCRFPNEYELLRRRGFKIIRVWAQETDRVARLTANGKFTGPDQLVHISETALDDIVEYPDLTLYNNGDLSTLTLYNNGDLSTLGEQVASYLNLVAR